MTEERELRLEDYQEYFVLDDSTGDLFIRTDLKDRMKELKGNRLWLLMQIFSYMPERDESEEEHLKNIELFEYGKGMAYKTRLEYQGMRDVLMETLVRRDGGQCRRCGSTDHLSIDHIVPVSRGGQNALSNLQILCRSCNSSKGAK